MLNFSYKTKKIISALLIGIIFLNFFYFTNPQKAKAACNTNNTQFNIELKNVGDDNIIKDSQDVKPQIVNITEKSRDQNNVLLQIEYKNPFAAPQGYFVADFYQKVAWGAFGSKHIYYTYKIQEMYLLIDDTTKTNIGFRPTTGGNPLVFNKSIPLDGKTHNFKLVVKYTNTDRCADTIGDIWDQGLVKLNNFTATSNVKSFSAGNSQCDKYKNEIESQMCSTVKCFREVAQEDKYWVKNKPTDTGAFLHSISAGTWDPANQDLNDEGKAKLQDCKNELKKLNNLSNQILNDPDCKNTVIHQDPDCTFGKVNSQDTPVNSDDKPDLKDLMEKLKKVEQKVDEMPTENTYGDKNDPCKKNCDSMGFTQIPESFICRSLCWISSVFMNFLNITSELLFSAISTETGKPTKPTIAPYLEGSNSSTSTSASPSPNSTSTDIYPTIEPTITGTLSDI